MPRHCSARDLYKLQADVMEYLFRFLNYRGSDELSAAECEFHEAVESQNLSHRNVYLIRETYTLRYALTRCRRAFEFVARHETATTPTRKKMAIAGLIRFTERSNPNRAISMAEVYT